MEDKTEKKEARKPYKTPTLTKYGKVEQVTQGGITPVMDTLGVGSK
jgi:hypothetical protein